MSGDVSEDESVVASSGFMWTAGSDTSTDSSSDDGVDCSVQNDFCVPSSSETDCSIAFPALTVPSCKGSTSKDAEDICQNS